MQVRKPFVVCIILLWQIIFIVDKLSPFDRRYWLKAAYHHHHVYSNFICTCSCVSNYAKFKSIFLNYFFPTQYQVSERSLNCNDLFKDFGNVGGKYNLALTPHNLRRFSDFSSEYVESVDRAYHSYFIA